MYNVKHMVVLFETSRVKLSFTRAKNTRTEKLSISDEKERWVKHWVLSEDIELLSVERTNVAFSCTYKSSISPSILESLSAVLFLLSEEKKETGMHQFADVRLKKFFMVVCKPWKPCWWIAAVSRLNHDHRKIGTKEILKWKYKCHGRAKNCLMTN